MDLPAGVQIKWVGRDDPETSEMSGEEAEVPVIQQMITSGKIYKISCASNPSIRLLKDPKNVGVTQSGPRNYDLDHKVVMRLLQLYKQNRSKVGGHTVPSLKRLWEIFASDINQVFGTEYTASQIENKWRVLERKHKKVYDKSNRGGRVFRYRKEMDEIFPDKKNINLQVLRDTNREPVDEHQPPGGSNAGTLTTARNSVKA